LPGSKDGDSCQGDIPDNSGRILILVDLPIRILDDTPWRVQACFPSFYSFLTVLAPKFIEFFAKNQNQGHHQWTLEDKIRLAVLGYLEFTMVVSFRMALIWPLIMCWIGISYAQLGIGTPDNPTLDPEGKTFVGTLEVTVTCQSRLYYVYYSTDGSNISTRSDFGFSPLKLKLSESTTLKAACVYSSFGYTMSDVVSEEYTLQQLKTPVADPGAGYYTGPVAVKLTAESGATIHYTTNGNTPTVSSSVPSSSGSITITPPQTLKAIATRSGYANSPVLSQVYSKKDTAKTPTCNCKDSTFTKSFNITLSSATPTANIYYTLDGTDPHSNENFYSVPITIPLATTTLRAYTIKENMVASPELKVVFTYQPKAPTPFSTPGGTAFTDTIPIQLKTSDTTVQIRYTLDGKTPTTTSPLYEGVILLDTTTVLSARSFPAPGTTKYAPSDLYQETFTLQLSAPKADKYVNGGFFFFRDSVAITLSTNSPIAQILYTLNGKDPVPGEASQLLKEKPTVVLSKDTTFLKVRAITTDKSIQSPVATWGYINKPKLPAPQAIPPGQVFGPTLRVRITNPDTSVFIAYTLNGKEPDSGNSMRVVNNDSLTLETTTILKMKAFRPNSDPSETSMEEYFLRPEPPIANVAAGDIAAGTAILLSCPTPGATIYYSLDSGPWSLATAILYSPSDSIRIDHSTKLQAVAYLGSGNQRQESLPLSLPLNVIVKQDEGRISQTPTTVPPYQIATPGKSFPDVLMEVLEDIPNIPNLSLQHPIQLKPSTPGGTVKVILNPTSAGYSLYALENGQARWITSQFPAVINDSGVYSLGIDSAPPQIRLLSHTVSTDDSTQVILEISDNILNPYYQYQTSSTNGFTAPIHLKKSTDTVALKIRNEVGIVDDLWFRIRAGDYHKITALPPDSALPFVLPQAFSKLPASKELVLGKEGYKWDLVGFPIALATPISTAKLVEDNPGFQFKAYQCNLFSQLQELNGQSPFIPGQGYWLASHEPLSQLNLSRVKTVTPDSDGVFRVRLHQGWNLIGNPTLSTMWWPITKKMPNHLEYSVRSLRGYSHTISDYVEVDSLVPFKGYFVYSTSPDTVVILQRQPLSVSVKKQASSNSSATWSLSLAETAGNLTKMPVWIGAYPQAVDEIGQEDEPMLTGPNGLRTGLRVTRDGRAFMGDYMKASLTDIHIFSLAFGNPREGQPIPDIQVQTMDLPNGMEAWAWLPERQLKQLLSDGTVLSGWTSSTDSLRILVGPKQALDSWAKLQNAELHPGQWSAKLRTGRSKLSLELELPTVGTLQIDQILPNGKRRILLPSQTLGAGFHRWDFANPLKSSLIRISGRSLKNGEIWKQVFMP
jgi:Chitobiase/beta-hexosaminidase C-terminal domain